MSNKNNQSDDYNENERFFIGNEWMYQLYASGYHKPRIPSYSPPHSRPVKRINKQSSSTTKPRFISNQAPQHDYSGRFLIGNKWFEQPHQPSQPHKSYKPHNKPINQDCVENILYLKKKYNQKVHDNGMYKSIL